MARWPEAHCALRATGHLTGKTQAVLNHWALPALASGADPSRVLLCSFTRAAAGELRERLAKDTGISVRALRETCSTVHAEALRRVRASRGTVKVWEGSKTKEQDDDDDAGPDLSREDRSLRDAAASAVSFCRNTLTYPDGLEVAAAKAAGSMRSSCGQDDILREIERYEQEKRDAGAMDFTDLLEHAALAETRPLDLLILDEAQDSTPLQWSVFEWWARSANTVIVVGDPDQCHPAGTMIQMTGGFTKQIEDVKVGDDVTSYHTSSSSFRGIKKYGKKVLEISNRPYIGEMLTLHVGKESVKCTPNHRVVARYPMEARNKFALYLMVKGKRARVGVAQCYYQGAQASGPTARARSEKANALWVLNVFNTKDEAIVAERVASATFGIPELVFIQSNAMMSQKMIDAVYDMLGDLTQKAKNCLAAFGRQFDFPIWQSNAHSTHYSRKSFVTAACNLIENVHEMKTYSKGTRDADGWFPVKIERAFTMETVYSLSVQPTESRNGPRINGTKKRLKVEGHKLYIANNIVVHNSIYQWAGSDSRRFVDLMGEGWEARRLGVSWRVPAIQHALARSIILRNTSRIDAPYDPKDHAGAVIKVREDGGAEALAIKTESRVLMLARTSAMLTRWATTLAEAGVPFINERGWSPFTPGGPLNACLAVLQLRLRGRTNAGLARALVRELPARGKQWLTNGRKQTLALIAGDEDTGYDMAALISLGINVSKLLELSAQDALGVLMCIARLDDYSSRRRINAILAAWSRGQDDALVDRPRITLTTMHASKGREAPLVIVSPQMASPAITARNEGKADEVEAERRVLYVAVTRSSETLVIDAAAPGEHYSELYHEGSLAPVVVTSDEVPF